MKILVTGHKGFIGSHIYYQLKMRGHKVVGYDKKDKNGRSRFYENLPDNISIVIHCAANLYDNFDENIKLTKRIAEKYKNSHIIFTSSAAVYGNTNLAKETDKLFPFGKYGESKAEEERIIKEKVRKYTILRLANVYGYGSDHGLIAKCFNEDPIEERNPSNIRDYINIRDVVLTMLNAANLSWEGILNVSTGSGIKNYEIWEHFNANMIPCKNKTEEIMVSVLDNKKLIRLGLSPNYFFDFYGKKYFCN